ncbi:MAG TPA: L,D-transpeptidase [Caulobacteraceae bacterium]
MPLRQAARLALLAGVALIAFGCDDFRPPVHAVAPDPARKLQQAQLSSARIAPAADTAPPAAPVAGSIAANLLAPAGSADPAAKAIETASTAPAPGGQAARDLLIRVEVLLARAHFSPGVIDGQKGANLSRAISAYQESRGGVVTGKVDQGLLDALAREDAGPVTQDYAITAEDVTGPFLGSVPRDFEALSKLPHLGYASPLEALAERFHMSQALLSALNPKRDFASAGASILVVRAGAGDLVDVARVEVDKSENQVRALDAGGKIIAAFPATVGSTERPAPSGEWAVKAVVRDPSYTYDPKRLTFGDKSKGPLTIAPGPNNPVGSTWIALTVETYGIHGAPDPAKVGKTASHGCVRLTNWDAVALGRAVKKGMPVAFVGVETRKA